MKHAPKGQSARTPPVPDADRTATEAWLRRVMPDLHPIVLRLDVLIREQIPNLQYAVKYKKAHYGTAALGWVIEMVSYDVSVNLVFYAGASFTNPPPLGEGSRYVKIRSLAEADTPEMVAWIREAGTKPGWK